MVFSTSFINLCTAPCFSPFTFPAGPVFGNMNQFTGLGVFIDTYPNANRLHDVSDSALLCTSDTYLREFRSCTWFVVSFRQGHDTFPSLLVFLAEVLPIHLCDAGKWDIDIWPWPWWKGHWAWGMYGSGPQPNLWHVFPHQILQKQTQGMSMYRLVKISTHVFYSCRSFKSIPLVAKI